VVKDLTPPTGSTIRYLPIPPERPGGSWPNAAPWSMAHALDKGAPHKTADNDNDDPPAVPASLAVALPVPGFGPAHGAMGSWADPY